MSRKQHSRGGTILVLAALMMSLMLGMIAFAVDVGYILLVRTQLQVAADSAALAAVSTIGKSHGEMLEMASKYAGFHKAAGRSIVLNPEDVESGIWDVDARTFTPTATMGNAVRVTARMNDAPLFFARIFGQNSFGRTASAVAMTNPRDIAFVVDLSGSMNDDTEPCWATSEINKTFGPEGYPTIGDELMQNLYDDFGFGSYPGITEYIGESFGVSVNKWAYAELTEDGGPLTSISVPDQYRILPGDSEAVRKQKGYSAIIDFQIARVMPAATPAPNSAINYAYWEKYLDYIILAVNTAPPKPVEPPGPPSPPKPPKPPTLIGSLGYNEFQLAMTPLELFMPLLMVSSSGGSEVAISNRGRIPRSQDKDRIHKFNNPNKQTFAGASSKIPRGFRNLIGYVTYVQFMADHGRDLKPKGNQYTPFSQNSPDSPWHWEQTAGGSFQFPPRSQPMHASRRALIAAMQVVKDRNEGISDLNQRDWISVITFDKLSDGPVIEQSLTGEYRDAMLACTRLQARGDKGASTATDTGLIAAQDHIHNRGRTSTNKIVVLLTDGVPNLSVSGDAYNAPLIQAAQMRADNQYLFPVGVGLGTDYEFMDQLARAGGTADAQGRSARGTGNPAEYEQQLIDIFEKIILNPQIRLVK